MREVKAKDWIGREVTIRIAVGRRLDLDHASAEIGQERGRIRTRDKSRAFDDGDMVENFNRHEILR